MPHSNNPPWLSRNTFVAPLLAPNSTIVDYGCGNKEFLNYYLPSEYLGIDKNPNANIVADLETYIPDSKVYDYGLVLGVLEYLNRPFEFIKKIKPTANCFIVLALIKAKKKEEWTNHFTESDFLENLQSIFSDVEMQTHERYHIFICQ
jgi:hypothetical protein